MFSHMIRKKILPCKWKFDGWNWTREKSGVDDFIAKVTGVSKDESNQYLRQLQDKREREEGDYKSQ